MKPLTITALSCVVLLALPAWAETSPFAASGGTNPFAAAKRDAYAGLFRSEAVRLALKREGEAYRGQLFHAATGDTYPVSARLADGKLVGVFTSGGQDFAFTFRLDEAGGTGRFETEGFKGSLTAAGSAAAAATLTPEVRELLDEALAIANSLPGDQRDAAISMVVWGLASAGDVPGAQELAESIRPTSSFREGSLAIIGNAQAENGHYDDARKTANRLVDASERDGVFVEIASHQARSGDVVAAKNSIGGISDTAARRNAYLRIAQAQAQRGDEAGARATLDEAWPLFPLSPPARGLRSQTRRSPQGEIEAAVHLMLMVKAYASTGHADHARSLLEYAADDDRAKLLAGIALGQALHGDRAGAAETAREVESRIRRVPDHVKSSLRMELAKTYGAAGDLAALERLNEAAIAAHAKLDKALRSMSKPIDVYFWAAQGAVEAEDLESAQRMAARVTDPSYRDFTASMVLGLQAKQDPRGALGAARAIPDATSRISAMATIAAAIARSAPPASPGPR